LNTLLWVLQIFMGLYFVGIGIAHFIVPPGLPALMGWMYELSPALHTFSGAAEILGGLGLIIPSVSRIKPKLSAYAAFGLALVMVGASFWHIQRGEFSNMGMNIVLIAITSFIGYRRLKINILKDKSS
jgi:putative oxidoreductase